MNILTILSMIGGLALFLYGMHILGEGLAKLSGGKLEIGRASCRERVSSPV